MDTVKCPHCGSTESAKVLYTWWGGFPAAKSFAVVKCQDCKKEYNGKTGKSLQNVKLAFGIFEGICLLALLIMFIVKVAS